MSKRIIYQTLPRLWGGGKLRDWDAESLAYLRSLGVDYVWYTGVPRHATGKDFVKGNPGSPYAISDWRDVNPYLADDPARRLQEFDALVARTHAAGLKLIIDYIRQKQFLCQHVVKGSSINPEARPNPEVPHPLHDVQQHGPAVD